MRVKLTKTLIDAAEPEAPRKSRQGKLYNPDLFLWDTEVNGLCLKVSPGGTKTFYYQYRGFSKNPKRVRLGAYGRDLTVQDARQRVISRAES